MTAILIFLTVGIVIACAWWVDRCWKIEHPEEEPKIIVTPPPPPAAGTRRIYERDEENMTWMNSRPPGGVPRTPEEVDRRIRGG